jgi:demethylmenaquinone methyltransferase/2-methoxy-6-polyprenyl-1,4-benzoquinol methylase
MYRTQAARDSQAINDSQAIYDTGFLRGLFDEMQSTYELVSSVTSFGFNRRWRKQLISLMGIEAGMRICDFMAGSGETWQYLLPRIGPQGSLLAVDFSTKTVQSARKRRRGLGLRNVSIREEDALDSSVPSSSIDAVVCAYGAKTLSPDGHRRLVTEIKRLLKAGGMFGVVEVSLPRSALLRRPYLLYLRYVVPCVGKLLLGNPQNYRMLSTYVAGFEDCRELKELFAREGFTVSYHSLFWGCATALIGRKQ